ncbi:MAG TPA: OmpA family protein [Stellaceae bacterium]|nr:OmpA family protein [Stellaceae bacterium]
MGASVLALVVGMAAAAPYASAQQDQGQPPQTQAQAGPAKGLEEIVVTAQKRQERVQDIPISVHAMTAEMLAEEHIQSTADLQLQVPSLVYNELVGFAEPYLRGIGSDLTQPNADASVATYEDGAFLSSTQGTLMSLLGIERVEVLEGPQGTLYGRNAVGGAINLYTLTPGDQLDADVTGTIGSYARKEGAAHISGPVTDNLDLGMYVAGTEMNTYLSRYTPITGNTPQDDSDWGLRFKAVYRPTDWLTLTGSVEELMSRSAEADSYRQIQPNAVGWLLGAPVLTRDRYTLTNDLGDYNTVVQRGAILREEADFTSLKVLGISSYRDTRNSGSADLDATELPVLGFTAEDKYLQYSQELQILSPDDSPVKWIGGLYWFHEAARQYPLDIQGAIFAPLMGVAQFGEVHTQSYAAFGQATIPLTVVADGMNLTLGARYSIDEKQFHGAQALLVPGGFGIDYTSFMPSSKKWESFTPKITLDYRWDGTLFYATYSKGFKSGTYNIGSPADAGPVNPEKLTAFEVGTKSDLFDGKVRINTSAYYYDFKDLQVEIVEPSALGSILLENAATAEAKGIEISTDYLVLQGLKLSAGVAYEQATYSSFPAYAGYTPAAAGNATISVDATGHQIQRAPKWVGTLSANYITDLDFGGSLAANASLYLNSGYFWDPQNTTKQDGYGLLNSSFTYTLPDDRWSVMLWGTNLTDTYYNLVSNVNAFGTDVITAPRRMVGITAKFAFTGEATPAPLAPPPAPPAAAPALAPAPTSEARRSFQVFFDFDKSNITDAAARVIQEAADAVKAGHVVQITVTGHTDTVGTAAYNQGLSERRAAAVKLGLVTDGVPGGEITTIGAGKNGLLVPTADGVREPQNRRAEIVLQ